MEFSLTLSGPLAAYLSVDGVRGSVKQSRRFHIFVALDGSGSGVN